jgi:hypothetical protein
LTDLRPADAIATFMAQSRLPAAFADQAARLHAPLAARKPRGHTEPVNARCALYGEGPRLSGVVAGLFAATPEWTDRPRRRD